MPQWLTDALTDGDRSVRHRQPRRSNCPSVITSSAVHGPPSRDDVLYKYACSLRGKGVTVTRAALADAGGMAKRCEQPPEHPYPLEKALEKIDRAWGYDYTSPNGTATARGETTSDELPPLVRLDEFLATPDEALAYRVDQLWPAGGRVILAAAWKAGKTTLLGNLIRSLVDGAAVPRSLPRAAPHAASC